MKGSLSLPGLALVLLGLALGITAGLVLTRWAQPSESSSATLGTPQEEATAPKEAEAGAGTSPTAGRTSASVSFRADILPIFEKNCTACHGVWNDLNLTDYRSVYVSCITKRPLIIPGIPEGSPFFLRLEKTPFMPPSNPLPNVEVDKIRQWILNGAPDN